jgi:hypothetical protein
MAFYQLLVMPEHYQIADSHIDKPNLDVIRAQQQKSNKPSNIHIATPLHRNTNNSASQRL